MDPLLAWKDIGFMLYAMLKAFLPLPSLEVLLIPLCVQEPASYLRYALEGAVGTCAGGLIGYLLARHLAERIARSLITPQQMEKGCRLMQRYGILAVFIGGITPIPDFILPYLAGFTRMNFLAFTLSDGISRFLRSLLIGYSISRAADLIDFQVYGNLLCAIILIWGMIKWIKGRYYAAESSETK